MCDNWVDNYQVGLVDAYLDIHPAVYARAYTTHMNRKGLRNPRNQGNIAISIHVEMLWLRQSALRNDVILRSTQKAGPERADKVKLLSRLGMCETL